MPEEIVDHPEVFDDWFNFEKMCHAAVGNSYDFGVLEPCNMPTVMFGLRWLRSNFGKRPLSDSVRRYVAAVAHDEGLLVIPIPEAQGYLDQINKGGHELKPDIFASLFEDTPTDNDPKNPITHQVLAFRRLAALL